MLVEVAVAAAVRGTFTYRVPPRLAAEAALGRRVAVPFGRSRRATGYVVGFPASPPAGVELRDVSEVLDDFPLFAPELIRLLRWAEDYYLAPAGELLRAALPPGLNVRRGGAAPARRGVEYAAPLPAAAHAPKLGARARAQRAVLDYLMARGRIPVDELRAAFPRGRPALAALAKRGLVSLETETPPPRAELNSAEAPPELTPAQSGALAAISGALGRFETFLLHGVTGSGKTEIYLQAIGRARAAGRGALVLVPEIALTPQLAGRFRTRFGNAVALLHSGLSDAERHGEWLRLRRGLAPICVGVRSAVFAPVQRLGILVVDEEHDPSFKQEDGPAYHARDVAVMRAKMEGAVCVLGSATPSLESLENARRGRYRSLQLPARIDDRPLPEVRLVDLSRFRAGGPPPGLLSPPLAQALAETLAARQQAILFLNRRGYRTLVLCLDCGKEARCQWCAVSLTYHSRRGILLCHYCGRSERMQPGCPECGGERTGVGAGTEQVQAAVEQAFPRARVARLDRDAISRADDAAAVLARFARREVDVLVGTQMVTKGHDFPGVTLVGVMLADTALALPDFRAAERTFQLLTQVAGRAGRGREGGRVLVQTYNPRSPAIACVVGHDYAGFSEIELDRRRVLGYPPFTRMLAVRVEALDARDARRCAQALAEAARPALGADVALLGPAPAAVERIRGRTRWHLLFKGADTASLRRIHRALTQGRRPPAGARVRFDMDPYAML